MDACIADSSGKGQHRLRRGISQRTSELAKLSSSGKVVNIDCCKFHGHTATYQTDIPRTNSNICTKPISNLCGLSVFSLYTCDGIAIACSGTPTSSHSSSDWRSLLWLGSGCTLLPEWYQMSWDTSPRLGKCWAKSHRLHKVVSTFWHSINSQRLPNQPMSLQKMAWY